MSAGILNNVCNRLGIPIAAIRGRSQNKDLVKARALIAKKMRAKKYTMPRIGRLLNRHHATVFCYLNPDYRPAKHRREKLKRNAK